MAVISFNGKTYNSLDEMPADQRAAYEQVISFMKDENNNGIPDMFEGDVVQKMITMASTRVIVNGREVQSIESLPPEARAKFEQAMGTLGQIGITAPSQSVPQMASSAPAFPQSPSFMQSSSSAITEEGGSRTGVIIAVTAALAVLFLCAFAAAGFLLFNR